MSITDGGSGYTSAPTVSFTAAPSGGTTAAATAALRYDIESVRLTNRGIGYLAAPTVTFQAAPLGGTTATAAAILAESGYDQFQNLLYARQTLAGKQLLVRVGKE